VHLQLEYSNENLSAFFKGVLNKDLKERILYLFGNGSFVQNWFWKYLRGNVKGGVNYN
jgi:hypothetical protein